MQELKKISAEVELEISCCWELNFYFSFFARMMYTLFEMIHSFTNSQRVNAFCNPREYDEKKYL